MRLDREVRAKNLRMHRASPGVSVELLGTEVPHFDRCLRIFPKMRRSLTAGENIRKIERVEEISSSIYRFYCSEWLSNSRD